MYITAQFNLDKIGYTFDQFSEKILKLADQWVESTPTPDYSYQIRDITLGWNLIGTVKDWKQADGPYSSGTYSLVLDLDNTATNPIFSTNTICFGETTQPGYKRIACHTGALKGNTTNMSDKYRKHTPHINEALDIQDLTEHLDKMKIFFREHRFTDEEWEFDRTHSVYMEKLCHSAYYAIHNKFPPGNTRDLPSHWQIEKTRKFYKNHKLQQKFSQQ
jgi:hypothetical protein